MALIARANRFRYPITAIAVVGLGALVALAVGVSLYLGLSSAAENTRRLIAQRSETLVNDLDRRITSQLQTVVQRSRWAVEQIQSGDVKMEDSQALNTFMLGRWIRELARFSQPMADTVTVHVEVNAFDLHKVTNPEVYGAGYQRGPLWRANLRG